MREVEKIVPKHVLTVEAKAWIDREFLDEEITEVVFSLPDDKAHDPDGYTATFFKGNWDIVKTSVLSTGEIYLGRE